MLEFIHSGRGHVGEQHDGVPGVAPAVAEGFERDCPNVVRFGQDGRQMTNPGAVRETMTDLEANGFAGQPVPGSQNGQPVWINLFGDQLGQGDAPPPGCLDEGLGVRVVGRVGKKPIEFKKRAVADSEAVPCPFKCCQPACILQLPVERVVLPRLPHEEADGFVAVDFGPIFRVR